MVTEERKRQINEAVKRYRIVTKRRMVLSMGGKCQICGYSKCDRALDFHHINPDEKEANFNKYRANPAAWTRVVEELRKCILLCSNCHSEVHAGLTSLPNTYETFNEDYLDYKNLEHIAPQNPSKAHGPDC